MDNARTLATLNTGHRTKTSKIKKKTKVTSKIKKMATRTYMLQQN